MNEERIYTVLQGPHISEKSTVIADEAGQVVFRVARDATKREVKTAVERLFDVRVRGVRTVQMKGKHKRFGRLQGRRAHWKKAYVTLESGQDIDFMSGAE